MLTETATPSGVTTVREATLADVPAIVRMGERFATAEYTALLAVNPQALAILAEQIITNSTSHGWVAERDGAVVGMLGFTTYVQPMSGETIASEICWWMDPEARGGRAALRMLAAGEAWARARGATRLQMIAPTDHVGAYYERLGFSRVEIHYQRGL